MIKHYITKYTDENGIRWAHAWTQINILRWCFCIFQRKTKI